MLSSRLHRLHHKKFLIKSIRLSSFPTHTKLVLPALSPTMETGNISSWLLKEGQEFAEGDALAEVETDKATVTWESVGDEGYIARIFLPDGSKNVKVGELVAICVENESDVAAFSGKTVDDMVTKSGATDSKPTKRTKSESKPESYPPHTVINLPALSPTMETGSLISWNVKVGDTFSEGDSIAEIETDKATVNFEMTEDGIVAKLLIPEGTKDITVGTPLLVTVEEGSVESFGNFSVSGTNVEKIQNVENAKVENVVESKQVKSTKPIQSKSSSDRVLISPLAKKILHDKNVNVSDLLAHTVGTGPNDRIRESDVLNFVEKIKSGEFVKVEASESVSSPVSVQQQPQQQSQPTQIIPPSTDYNWTLESKQTIPHFYLTMDINLTKTDDVLGQLNKLQNKVVLNRQDLILKAVAAACKNVPEANSEWLKSQNIIRQFISVNVELGDDTHIYNVGGTGLSDISQKSVDKSRDAGTPTTSVYTFMDSEVDTLGAIIKPGQAVALTVGGIRKELIVGQNNEPEVANLVSVTLSCDHRLVDGAVGAEWLKWFKMYLENPIAILL